VAREFGAVIAAPCGSRGQDRLADNEGRPLQ